MIYKTPVKIYNEENAVRNHAEELGLLGRKALIVTGRNSAVKCGALDDVLEALKSVNIDYALYDKVEENPSTETVMEARDFGLNEGCDFVIGIGGGSPLDASKSISVMMYHKDKNADFLFIKGYEHASDMSGESLPVVSIPTTCGTGSEATAVSVLTRKELENKQSSSLKFFPVIAFLDHRYLKAAPMSLITNTSVDTLGHLLESFVHTSTTPVSAQTVREGLNIWSLTRNVLTGEREPDDADYKNLLLSANLGGQAIAQTGTSLPHALSYRLTYSLHIPHGRAIGFFLPGFLKFADKDMIQSVLDWSGFANFDEFEDYIIRVTDPGSVDKAEWNRLTAMSAADILKAPDRIARVPYPVDQNIINEIKRGCGQNPGHFDI